MRRSSGAPGDPPMKPETSSPPPSAGLYPRLLGAAWSQLEEGVRRMHADGASVTARGPMRVAHDGSRLGRLLARLARLPREASAAETDLRIIPEGEAERWVRTFDGRRMVTRQFLAGELLAERMGGFEIRFRMEVADGALHYRQVSAALALGPLTIPLPRGMGPVVSAWERSVGPERTRVSVTVRVPAAGMLVSYEGEMERSGDDR